MESPLVFSSASLEKNSSFLPDFCANSTVFLTVLLAELFALVLALNETNRFGDFWNHLALISLFVQWVVLAAAAVLCLCKRWLVQLGPTAATLAVLGLTQLVTLGFSLMGGRFLVSSPEWAIPSLAFSIRSLAIAGIITLITLRYFYIHHQWQRQIEAESRARLRALQARIHPHFLFNTLNTIASLIPSQPDRAEQAVLDLADLLRSALTDRSSVSLAEELELTRRYLAIERLRMGERLTVDWQLGEDLPLGTLLPPLVLQPLVENAIRHGLQRLPEGGTLTLCIDKQLDKLCFTLINPRSAADTETGQRIAQDNIRQRLALAYPLSPPLEIIETAERYQVTFTIPLKQ
ncbi:MAG: histidine kinase [Gammaproteobacteria bacterium]|nr:histidine kinase [Gammaproteobacteria bacterium]MCP5195749.1 histidine kinase [Gammaproteobacteria bacterium]